MPSLGFATRSSQSSNSPRDPNTPTVRMGVKKSYSYWQLLCIWAVCRLILGWIFDHFNKSTCDMTLASLQKCTCSDVPQVYQLQHWCWGWGSIDRCHQVPDMIQWDRVMSHRGLERVPPLNLQRVPYDRLFIAPPQPTLRLRLHLSSVLPWNALCRVKYSDFWRL